MNIAKILKNCPKGTKLYSLLEGEVTLKSIDDIRDYPIEVCGRSETSSRFTEDGLYLKNKPNGECLLFPSKYQRDWNKFRLPIKNGDVMMLLDGTCPFIATGETRITTNDKEAVKCHCALDSSGSLMISDRNGIWISSFYIPASVEARMKLFNAMNKNGISFDEEKLIKKTEVKSKSKKHEFKPFEKILVKDRENGTWKCNFFSHMEEINSKKFYACCSGIWSYVIPYKGNENLVGTTNNPDQTSLIQCPI